MATYIRQEAGRYVQSTAVSTTRGAADADKIVATDPAGLIDDSLMGAATTGNDVVLKTNAEGHVEDAAMNAAESGNNVVIKTDDTGKLLPEVLPDGFGADLVSLTVGAGGVTAGDYIHILPDFSVVKADASNSRDANGFVLTDAIAAAQVEVYFEGTNTGVSGQSPGAVYLSDTIPGTGQATAPTAAGSIVQLIGFGAAANKVNFDSHDSIFLEPVV